MRPIVLGLLGVAAFVVGLAVGELGDPRPGAPCVEDRDTGRCVPVPESEGLLFIGRVLIVAGFLMAVLAAARIVAGRMRRGP